ncbi:hypothetical protein M413DRAFT_323229 [Hebeloma cylindrosporum]|uniref:Uncharacterized protein n=1 Tax=Hebeloma cylindrosporum TaxID=76867 RepID=A0A0C3BVB9_HEBCY|nr:hypothetical protein M413DRAFT_323229 [Hebeloma cylindrosporum h7]
MENMGDISQSFKRWLNRTTPINRLPPEILTQVFKNLHADKSHDNEFPPRFTLTRTHHISDAKDSFSWIPVITNICN